MIKWRYMQSEYSNISTIQCPELKYMPTLGSSTFFNVSPIWSSFHLIIFNSTEHTFYIKINLLIERNFMVKTWTNTLGDVIVCRHLRIFKKLFMFAAISDIIYICNYLNTFGNVTISSQKKPASLMPAI